MDYEGKFRDFMVGWLAQQAAQPETRREDMEALYQTMVEAESDREAVAEIRQALGAESAQNLWRTCEQWHDPAVEQAQPMLHSLRTAVQEDGREPGEFYLFFLNPFEDGCVPVCFADRLEYQICWMFRVFYHIAAEAVLAPKGWLPDVVVEPAYENASNIIVLAYWQENVFSQVLVYQRWHKAWHLHFDSLPALAEELLRQRQAIEQRATLPILGYHLTQMLVELIDQMVQKPQGWGKEG